MLVDFLYGAKKALLGALATFLITKVGLDAAVVESIVSTIVVALSVYVPRNA